MNVSRKKKKQSAVEGGETSPAQLDSGPQFAHLRPAGHKKQIVIAAVVILVLLVAGGVYAWNAQSKSPAKKPTTVQQTPAQAAAQKAYDDAVKKRDHTAPPEGQAKDNGTATVSQPATGPNNTAPSAAAAKATIQ